MGKQKGEARSQGLQFRMPFVEPETLNGQPVDSNKARRHHSLVNNMHAGTLTLFAPAHQLPAIQFHYPVYNRIDMRTGGGLR